MLEVFVAHYPEGSPSLHWSREELEGQPYSHSARYTVSRDDLLEALLFSPTGCPMGALYHVLVYSLLKV